MSNERGMSLSRLTIVDDHRHILLLCPILRKLKMSPGATPRYPD